MRKIFLIPLLTLMCSVMAWGSEITVNNFADLKTALSSEGTADVVKLGQNIAYSGTEVLNIERSLTLDGQGHKITGYGKLNTKVNIATTTNFNTVIAVNYQGNVESALEVAIQNLYIGSTENARHYGIIAFDGVKSLLLQNDSIVYTKGTTQPICVNGYQSTALELTIKDSYIQAGPGGYPAYILKPINADIKNSTFSGYCGLYLKMPNSTTNYGNNIGAAGSVVEADACTFDCPNTAKGESNNFAIFPIEDHNITLNLHNCSYNAENLAANNGQRLVNLQYNTRTTSLGDVYVNISGDNTHIYNIENNDPNKLIWNGFVVGQGAPSASEGLSNQTMTDIHVTISGGTLNINPKDVRWFAVADNKPKATVGGQYNDQSTGSGKITIAEGYEVSEVKQGEATLYRVVKKAAEKEPGVMYDLNDLVTGEGVDEGNNPVSSFDLSTGTDMTLNQETTTAGYVQISDNATAGATTVTVAKNNTDIEHSQTLVINNGLDVQGSSSVTVEPTAALVIGEGGITTQSPENIVIEADEDGAASLLLHPEITVNQTPELTVKMTAKQIGKVGADYFWHRFAMPVDAISSLPRDTNVVTKIFGWDYENEDWKSLSTLADLKPFYGYTLTTTADRLDVTYTFKGHLVGNLNETLNFTDEGYNFFGNSYTGYIDIVSLADQLLDHADIDAAVWVWNTDEQNYKVVTLGALKEAPSLFPKWQREIAPMQTFILRLATPGVKSASTVVDYKSAIWDNPRYGNGGGAGAPARKNAFEGNAIRMTVAANGMSDEVLFIEKANFSDEFDKGYDGTKYMNTEAINIYSTVNNENYSAVATDQIEGKMLTIETVNDVNYTISFDVVLGETEYALRDNATNKVIAIEEGASYEFAAQPNSTVEGRFEIVDRANVVTSIDNAQDNKANVKGIYTIMGQYVGENFDVLPTGVYVVDGVKIVK